MIVKALPEGERHPLLLQVRLKDNAKAAKPGAWPAVAHPADLELQLAVPTTVYHWLQAFYNLRWRGKPDRQIGATHWEEWLQADAQGDAVQSLGPAPATGALDTAAPGRALAPHTVPLANLPFDQAPEGAIQKSVPLPPARGGQSRQNAPYVQTSTTQAGRCWNTWRGMGCTPPPRWTTRRRPPTSSKGGHGGPRGMPRTPGALRPQQPATRRARRRRPERPWGLAVQSNKDPSPRDWPPWPLCGPRWEWAPHTPWPWHTQVEGNPPGDALPPPPQPQAK